MREIKLKKFTYRPGYCDMRGARHEEVLRKNENGEWTIISEDREYFNDPLRITSYAVSADKVEEFELDDEREGSNISTYIKEVQIEDLLGRDPIVLNNTLVRSHIKGSVVLITGACGSIGSEIVRQVATYKAKSIVLVDQAETPMHDLSLELQAEFPDAEVVLFMGDVHNKARMEEAFNKFQPKYVFVPISVLIA